MTKSHMLDIELFTLLNINFPLSVTVLWSFSLRIRNI